MKVAHVITGLGIGGAEVMLYQLLGRLQHSSFRNEVISLTDMGPVSKQIGALGVPVRALGMRKDVPNPVAVLRLARWLREIKPCVVQTWLYHGDLIGGIAAKIAGARSVAWGIHNNQLDEQSRPATVWTAKVCARLSHYLPTKIVCVAEASRRIHAQIGYAANKMLVIPNGFDLERFKPDTSARRSLRKELNIADDAPLVGLFGRFHPHKDYENFVQAAALVCARLPQTRFLLCGERIDWQNRALVQWIEKASLQDKFYLLGRRQDVARLYAALDLFALSSYSEAFPMVVGEAMACGVPCAVTDVGDAALIVGDTGRVVPAKNPQALAARWLDLIEMNADARRTLGALARKRVQTHYSLASVAARYEDLYRDIGCA